MRFDGVEDRGGGLAVHGLHEGGHGGEAELLFQLVLGFGYAVGEEDQGVAGAEVDGLIAVLCLGEQAYHHVRTGQLGYGVL